MIGTLRACGTTHTQAVAVRGRPPVRASNGVRTILRGTSRTQHPLYSVTLLFLLRSTASCESHTQHEVDPGAFSLPTPWSVRLSSPRARRQGEKILPCLFSDSSPHSTVSDGLELERKLCGEVERSPTPPPPACQFFVIFPLFRLKGIGPTVSLKQDDLCTRAGRLDVPAVCYPPW